MKRVAIIVLQSFSIRNVYLIGKNDWWRYYIETETGNIPNNFTSEINSDFNGESFGDKSSHDIPWNIAFS